MIMLLEFSSTKTQHSTLQTTVITLTMGATKEIASDIFTLASEVKRDKIANFHLVPGTILSALYMWWNTLTLTMEVHITTSHTFPYVKILLLT